MLSGALSGGMNILIIILILGFLIFIHELGHFVVAKLSKVRVDAFAIGMGPKLISKKWGETTYSINILPIGGYVAILGESPSSEKDQNDPRNFQNKGIFPKLGILLAGVTMNFFVAIVLMYVILSITQFQWFVPAEYSGFKPKFGSVEVLPLKYAVVEGGFADKSDMPKEGIIQAVNYKDVVSFDDFKSALAKNKNKTVVVRACENSPEMDNCNDYDVKVSDKGLIQISLDQFGGTKVITYKGSEKALGGFIKSVDQVRFYGYIFGHIFDKADKTGNYDEVALSLSGPVSLYVVIDELKSEGFLPILMMVADLSLTLAVMNLLPIPALDGGRVILVFVEAIVKRIGGHKKYKKIENIVINISYGILIVFMIAVFFKDFFYLDKLRDLIK